MLRLAKHGSIYEVSITMAGEPIKMQLRSLSLIERLELVQEIAQAKLSPEGIKALIQSLGKVIASIEGYEESPAEVLELLEHRKDIDELATSIVRWCHLSEQESKNLDSSPERSDPAPGLLGSAEKSVGSEQGPVSIKEAG
jgi:hypothetical protein